MVSMLMILTLSTAAKCYAVNHSSEQPHQIHGDIRAVSALPHHTLLTAGFPCQSFSSAGSAEGLQCRNGQLVFEVVRLLRASQIQCFVLENVSSSQHHVINHTNLWLHAGSEFVCTRWRQYTCRDCGFPTRVWVSCSMESIDGISIVSAGEIILSCF
jgi:site-specific DNA-cytosine methylase